MVSAVEEGPRRRLRAPRRSGECLLDPPPVDWQSIWQENLQRVATYPDPVAAWRSEARRELYSLARQHTSEYLSLNPTKATIGPLVLTGHQPSLFHPGVWFKNFVLSQLGRQFSATAIQLVIDNDLYRQASIRVPTGSLEHPRVAQISFDQVKQAVPFEMAAPTDMNLFGSFGDRVCQSIRPFVDEALIRQFWPRALEQLRRTGNVGLAFAAARHSLEAENGLETLELPLSSICRSSTFRRFVAHCLDRGRELAEIHNRCLAEFRARRKLRSPSQPVPDLDVSATEIEMPFWVWTIDSPFRRRLYVRRSDSKTVLTDRGQWECGFDNEKELAARLVQLENDGVVIRPRAMMTTMFARLVLSDLFVHGIGGAVYDLVTDEIVKRFFLVEPPKFLTMTATFHLPITHHEVTERDLIELEREKRELIYHPEKFLGTGANNARELIAAKRTWIDRRGTNVNLKERHEAIAHVNRQLFGFLKSRVTDLEERRFRIIQNIQRSAIVGSREYSFVLFPNSLLSQLRALTPDFH